MDASRSFDPDNLPQPLSFQWSCVTVNENLQPTKQTCMNQKTQELLMLPNDSIITLTAGSLSPGSYRFTVIVSKGNRTSSAWVTITVLLSAQKLDMAIPMIPLKINPDEKLVIEASVIEILDSLQYSTFWNQVKGDINFEPNGDVLTSLDLLTLVVQSFAMNPGSKYAFRLSAFDTSNNNGRRLSEENLLSFAQVEVVL